MNFEKALYSAQRLQALLSPYCERIEIAGSIRRRKPDVRDIELVAIPRMRADESSLFSDAVDQVSDLDSYLNAITLQSGSVLTRDHITPRWGDKYKRLWFQEFAVDLFIVTPPAQWGLIYFLRTGPANWSHHAVTKRSAGGFLPAAIECKGGHLERTWTVEGEPPKRETIETPEERDVFEALEIEWKEPWERV